LSVACITQISTESPVSLVAALREGIARANKTLRKVKSAWLEDRLIHIDNGEIVNYRVHSRRRSSLTSYGGQMARKARPSMPNVVHLGAASSSGEAHRRIR